MNNPRKYGYPPYIAALVHGGPGAAGDMKPVAERLSKTAGIIEPLQTKQSIQGLIIELDELLHRYMQPPFVIAGHSWGAWLSCLYAAEKPSNIKKLILISCPPFEEKYAVSIQGERVKRLKKNHVEEIDFLMDAFENPAARNKDKILSRIGEIMSTADSYDPETGCCKAEVNSAVYRAVWSEAKELRRSGKLIDVIKRIKCPVTAIHGLYDPHPASGVEMPLKSAIRDFKFTALEKCGHTPWVERQAKEEFFAVLQGELGIR
ncbi:MAG TPA: alpha/beta hydrolase [Candidatus Goldiibacteriota bacterium]|nr:alpha/beta hydrolase [Candidatus Goldiibacteriota bacterium]